MPSRPVRRWRVSAGHVTLVYRGEPLTCSRVTSQPAPRRVQPVTPELRLETPHRSPQPPLGTWGEGEWLPMPRLTASAPRQASATGAGQPPLFALEQAKV